MQTDPLATATNDRSCDVCQVLENFEERIQLRRALLDGENAVRELLVDRGKAQVAISQWETDGPPVDTNNAGTSEETKTPRSIQQWNQNLRSVQTKLAHAAQTNEDLKARLADNMRTLHNLESSLPHRVKNNDLRAFLQLIYRVQALQIENMALEDAHQSSAHVVKSKDLEIEKLKLQVQLRDQMIEEHHNVLTDDQKGMIRKHVSFLPCKTVTKWEGEVHETPLSARLANNGVAKVQVPNADAIQAGAIQGAAKQVAGLPQPAHRERSAEARARTHSSDTSACANFASAQTLSRHSEQSGNCKLAT